MKKIAIVFLLSVGFVYAESFKIEIQKSDVELQIGDNKPSIVSKGIRKSFNCEDTVIVLHGEGVAVLYKNGKEIKKLTVHDKGGYHRPKEDCEGFFKRYIGMIIDGLDKTTVHTNEVIATNAAKGGVQTGIDMDITLDKNNKYTLLSAKVGQWGEEPYILTVLKEGKVVETLHSHEYEDNEISYVGFILSQDIAKKGDSYEIKSDVEEEPFRGVVGMHGKIIR